MQPRFSGPLEVEKHLYKEKWKMLGFIPRSRTRQFWVVKKAFSLIDENGNIVDTVPVGFKTDFSSVPLPFRGIFPQDDVDTQAAVFHDWLYHSNKKYSVIKKPENEKMPRKECDHWFLVGMAICGQDLPSRRLKYRAVRLGGWYGWNKKDKDVE